MVRMVCESTTGYICKHMIYDASGINLQDTDFELLDPYPGQGDSVCSIQFSPIVSKAKPPGKKSHISISCRQCPETFFKAVKWTPLLYTAHQLPLIPLH
jgi:hypothetical protein